MAHVQPRLSDLAGNATPWRPRLQLWEQCADAAARKRPVLYIHGATFAAECSIFFRFGGVSWADCLNDAGFSVWCLDFAGFGGSERYPEMAAGTPPPGASLGRAPDAVRQAERAVRAILAETGADRVSIVAHSWGTMVAGLLATDHPAWIDRLVLFGPVVRRDTHRDASALGPWRFVTTAEQHKRFVADVPAGENGVLAEADFPAWSDRYLQSDPSSASRSPPSVKTPNGPAADILSAWSGALPYDPSRIAAPVAIVRGAWDTLCDDADAAWLTRALVGAPEVRDVKIPNATHLMHLETGRTALYAAATDFLVER